MRLVVGRSGRVERDYRYARMSAVASWLLSAQALQAPRVTQVSEKPASKQ